MAVVASLVMSEGVVVVEGYEINDEGCLAWTGEADMIEEDEKVEIEAAPAAMGRGHRTKTESQRYMGWVDSDKVELLTEPSPDPPA